MNALQTLRSLLSTRHDVAKSWKREGKRVIGWNCTYVPQEVIYAADALPVMIFGDLESTKLADAYLPNNTCSFARSCFNMALKGDYDYLDGFVASNSCDNRDKMYDLWRYHTKIPYIHFINTPHSNTEKAHRFFYEEVVGFKKSLERAFGTAISDEALKNAIKVYNENRTLLKKIYELRMRKPPLVSGVEALEITLSGVVSPKEEHNKLLNQFHNEVFKRTHPPREGVRLLVSGSMMDNTELLRIVESAGGNVVADDLCIGSRYFWDLIDSDGDPLRAIAERYLGKIPSPYMLQHEARLENAVEIAKRYDVEGAIIFALKFCDSHLFDAPHLTEELKALGLPVLHLEWEHSMSGIAGLKTRIEAFIEMIGGVK